MTTTLDECTRGAETALKERVEAELAWTPGVDSAHVGVSVSGGAVRLSGEVDSYAEKLSAAKAVQRVRGVTAIAQEITVCRGGARLTDTDVARVVGAALQHATDVPEIIYAAVHDGVVTLSGAATNHQRRAAVQAVAFLHGVRDVNDSVTVVPGAPTVLPTIKRTIAEALWRNARIVSEIEVACDDAGVVTLSGAVRSFDEKKQAAQAAWCGQGVSSVVDQMVICPA